MLGVTSALCEIFATKWPSSVKRPNLSWAKSIEWKFFFFTFTYIFFRSIINMTIYFFSMLHIDLLSPSSFPPLNNQINQVTNQPFLVYTLQIYFQRSRKRESKPFKAFFLFDFDNVRTVLYSKGKSVSTSFASFVVNLG